MQIPLRFTRMQQIFRMIFSLIKPHSGMLLLGVGFITLNRMAALVVPASTKYVVDDVVVGHQWRLLIPLTFIVAGAAVVQAVSLYWLTCIVDRSAQCFTEELRCRVHEHLVHLPVSYFDTQRTRPLISRVMTDVAAVEQLGNSALIGFIGNLLTTIVAVVYMLHINVLVTLIGLGALAGSIVVLQAYARKAFPMFHQQADILGTLTGRLSECLEGIRVVKGYAREFAEVAIFDSVSRDHLDVVLKLRRMIAVMNLKSGLLIAAGLAGVTYVGVLQISAGTLSVGGFVTLTALMALLFTPMLQLSGIGAQFTQAVAGIERAHQILLKEREDVDPDRSIVMASVMGELLVDQVCFSYVEGSPVLQNISIKATPGSFTALVGPSGSGKSTLLRLLAAFYSPNRGRVLVDGIDLRCVTLDSYRRQVGVVSQETFLFDGTLEENILFSRPDATHEEVLEACRSAGVLEFAKRLPNKLNTMVGERGVQLSGGERQRLSLARAVLAAPPILLLDEPTSSLDFDTEALVHEALEGLLKNRTTFIVAHRLSTIRHADDILVFENGQISEQGTHEELMAIKGYYYRSYSRENALLNRIAENVSA